MVLENWLGDAPPLEPYNELVGLTLRPYSKRSGTDAQIDRLEEQGCAIGLT